MTTASFQRAVAESRNVDFSSWTDLFDRPAVVRRANDLIDDLISEIHGRNLAIHKDLDTQELALLYRFPIHVGVNIFVERLLRVAHSKEMNWNQSYPEVSYQPRYFKDTNESVPTHYMDFALNNHLLHRIYRILGGPAQPSQNSGLGLEQPRPQDAILYKPLGFLGRMKKTVKTLIDRYVTFSKPEVVGEYSNWMREILPYRQMMSFNDSVCNYPIDHKKRSDIKDCCRAIFLDHVDCILNTLDAGQKEKLSSLFADFIDHILPKAIVEELAERFSYYETLIKNWNLRQVHSFIGYYYSENYKVFAILARRRGAILIGHAHGASNPASSYKQCRNELAFVDFYFTWGIKDSTWMSRYLDHDRLNLINLGSTYLSTIRPWEKRKIDSSNMILLFPSGPMVDFMGDLQEITPERNYAHRIQTLRFLKELRKKYPGLRILYKPFPGTFTDDPIKTLCADEFREGILKLVQEKPSALYHTVDMVLWDTISTGFFESVSSGVPTLVYQSREEYEQSAPLGRELDDKLSACGMLFHDVESGHCFFDRIIRDLDGFILSRRDAVRKFQEAAGYPINKKEFLATFSTILPQHI